MMRIFRRNILKGRSRVARNRATIAGSLLFDRDFYAKQSGIPKKYDGIKHFCSEGWKKGYSPSRFFDTKFYLETYGDVRATGVNPLIHYLTDGGKERRTPSPAFDVVSFCEAHKDRLPAGANPAELCLEWYGSYDWRGGRYLSVEISPTIEAAFRKKFDEAFYVSMNPDVVASGMEPYDHFISQGQYEDRDPAPEFDIYAYRQRISQKPLPLSNPLIHYVEAGAELGWLEKDPDAIVIAPNASQAASPEPLSTCVHAHLYYSELLSEMLPCFRSLPEQVAIVITVISEADRHFVEQVFAREGITRRHEVRVVPNRGRDLGPFIVGCRDLWWAYELVLHVHTKRSPHVPWGDRWRQYLLDQTIGSGALVAAIIDRFRTEPDLGCLYPRNFHMIRRFVQREANAATIDAALDRIGHQGVAWQHSDYPAGSMAWYRTAPMRSLVETFGSPDFFEDERNQLDGTFAHVLERLLPAAARAAGTRVVSYITPRREHQTPLKGFPQRESSGATVPERWYRDTPRIARRPSRPLAPLSRGYDPNALDIHWIVPSFSQGAGGHMTIFRIVEFLETFGHHQTIWLQNAVQFTSQAAAKQAVKDWYRPIGDRVQVRFLPEDVRELSGDALIATDCWTAFPAAETQNFKERFYFVQDYEPSFHPTGELQLIAEATYDFGFSALCAGTWLHKLMIGRGLWARSWDLCADKDVYFPGAVRSAGEQPPRIAFYARAYTPRRAVVLGFAALEELHRRGVAFHVDLFGEGGLAVDFDFPHTQRGILSPTELGELYRACDIGLVFSTTNYSLIPLEMMACDLPVVEIDTPSTREVFRNGEVTFAKPLPYTIADEIEALLADPERCRNQRSRGRDFVAATSWENSARKIEAAMRERLEERGFRAVDPAGLAAPSLHQKRKATVFVPTFNAGPAFKDVLDVLVRQTCDFSYDVLVIDSASSDGTADLARGYADRGVRVESIPQSEFQHGRTRNLGIAWSDGEHVAVITQDARPKDDRWLSHLIAGFDRGPRVAGVIGRHEAYPEHDDFTRRDMTEMFDGLALLPPVIDRDIGLPSYIYPGGRAWRMLRQFYSDNNSAMSREAWKIVPYPEIDWGEDQVWSDEMLRLGFQKAYVDEAVVYHSHAFELAQHYKTSRTEGLFWGRHYGFDLHPDAKAAIAALDARDQDYALRHGIREAALAQRRQLNRATVEGREAGYSASRNE